MRKPDRKAAAATLAAPATQKQTVTAGCSNGHLQPHGGVQLEEAIRVRAYKKWDQAGRPPGDGVSFWLEAEQELKASNHE
jgi:hypothetical protein